MTRKPFIINDYHLCQRLRWRASVFLLNRWRFRVEQCQSYSLGLLKVWAVFCCWFRVKLACLRRQRTNNKVYFLKSALECPGMEWCCKLAPEFSSLLSETALDANVFDVRTGVVMPHSISILSGSTLSVSMPVKLLADGVVVTAAV